MIRFAVISEKKGPKVLRAAAVKRIAFVLSMIVLTCEFSKEIIICPLNRVHPAKKLLNRNHKYELSFEKAEKNCSRKGHSRAG